jgi:transposase
MEANMQASDNHLITILEKVDQIYAPPSTPKRGHPYDYSELVMLKVFLLMVLKRIKEFAALYRYRHAHEAERVACGLAQMPDESTLRKRLKQLQPSIKRQIQAWGRELIKAGVTSAEVVAVDKKMIEAQGPLWHQSDRQEDRIPDGLRGVDQDSSWSYSPYRGWVQGYGAHIAVTATAGQPIAPVWSEFTKNSVPEGKVARELGESLPNGVKKVVGDSHYDDPELRHAVERYEQHLLERCLMVPLTVAENTPGKRRRYASIYENNRDVYRRRKVTIEPFFDRLDQCFSIEPAWMKGLENNRSIGLLWVAAYQLMMLYLHEYGENPEHVKQLVDIL